jgi:subtilase family serine protease
VNGPRNIAAPLLVALALAACNAGGSSSLPGAAGQSGAAPQSSALQASGYHRACSDTRVGYMNCDVLISTKIQPNVAGWGPTDFQTAYNLPSGTKGAGQVVAIVDAYDNPNVSSNLATYRTNFGLGTANFTKYNQTGQTKNYPSGNQNWGVEIDLDVEMVSAVCPKCTIILVEANDNSTTNLYAAEKEAVTLGAHVVSNSWGGGGGSSSGGAFDTAGVVYLASAGDNGYGTQDPADYATVVSVGGTTLSKQGTTYKEAVWALTGGGCSVVTKPSWQHDPKCSERTENDVAAVAYGVAEYDNYGYSGWITIGGTSVSSPMIGGVFGLAGNASSHQSGKHFWTLKAKKLKKSLHTTIAGGVIHCPASLAGSYLCVGDTGQYKTYAGPVGWGTPNGIGAF